MQVQDTLGHFIGGEWTKPDGQVESINPSNTADVVTRAPDGDQSAVDRAVDAANSAQPLWASASPEVRADLLHKIGEKLFERSAELGELLAREEGKTRGEGIGETLRAARIFRYFAGEALRRHGLTLESTRPGLDAATYRDSCMEGGPCPCFWQYSGNETGRSHAGNGRRAGGYFCGM